MMNQCVIKKQNGANCQANDHCVSSNCVDGVCCSSACDGECQRCNAPGAPGTCQNIPQGQTDPQCTAPMNVCSAGPTPACKLPNGQACTANADCASNNCSAMVCAP
jgi:hypothetical protein